LAIKVIIIISFIPFKMKRLVLTALVLGGVALGSSLLGADNSQKATPEKEEKKIIYVDKEAALRKSVEYLNAQIRTGASNPSLKKRDEVKKKLGLLDDPNFLEKVTLNFSRELKLQSEDKVAAKVNANMALDGTGRIDNLAVSGETGLARIVMNYDARNKRSTTQLSVGKNETRVDVTLRDYKNPLIKSQLKINKEVRVGAVYDPKIDYASANVNLNYKGASIVFNQEQIAKTGRTTMQVNYALPIRHDLPVKSISFTHVKYNNITHNSIQTLGKLGPFDLVLSAQKIGKGKYTPLFMVKYGKKF
jgi:hypothetical protein